MKLRYLLSTLVAMMLTCAAAEAQLYESLSSSTTKIKIRYPSNVSWYGRAGGLLSKADIDPSYESIWYPTEAEGCFQPGFNLTFGMEKPFTRKTNFFWGLQFGLSSIATGIKAYKSEYADEDYYSYKEAAKYSFTVPTVFVGPTFGYHKQLNDKMGIDIHFSPQFHYVLMQPDDYIYSGYDTDNNYLVHAYQRDVDVDIKYTISGEFGVGLWIKRFIVDVGYRFDYDIKDNSGFYGLHNVMLSVGYVFKQPK
jgi:hypothetical protein